MKNIKSKRNELYKTWTNAKQLLNGEEQTFEQFQAIYEIEDEAYNQWKFYDRFIKAKEKIENEKNKRNVKKIKR